MEWRVEVKFLLKKKIDIPRLQLRPSSMGV